MSCVSGPEREIISMHRSRRGKYVVQAGLAGVFDLKPRASGGWYLQPSQTSRLATRAEAQAQLCHKLPSRRAMRHYTPCKSIIAAQHSLALAQLFENLLGLSRKGYCRIRGMSASRIRGGPESRIRKP